MADERRRSTPTPAQLAAWREYLEAGVQVRRALAAGMTGESGISLADYEVLLALAEADGRRLRSSTLAERAGWERSRLSHHLARMERRGLIAREECLTDSRGAEVVLTDAGADVFRRSSVAHLALIRRLFVDALTPAQLASAQELSGALRAHLDARRPAAPPG